MLRTKTPEAYADFLKQPRAPPVNGSKINTDWEEEVKKFYRKAPEYLKSVFKQAVKFAIEFNERGFQKVYFIGASGSHNANEVAKKLLAHVSLASYDFEFMTVDCAMDLDTSKFRNALVVFTSRTGTTPDTVNMAKMVSSAEINALTVAMTDINSRLSLECHSTIHMPSCFEAQMRDGELVTTMAPLVMMAGILNVWAAWEDAENLMEILYWACRTIPKAKIEKREELYKVAKAILAIQPKDRILMGPPETRPLRAQAAYCFASELLKELWFAFDTFRTRWGVCEAIDEETVIIRLGGDPTAFAEREHRRVTDTTKSCEFVIPLPGFPSIAGPKWLKLIGMQFVQIGLVHSIFAYMLAETRPGEKAWSTPIYCETARPDLRRNMGPPLVGPVH